MNEPKNRPRRRRRGLLYDPRTKTAEVVVYLPGSTRRRITTFSVTSYQEAEERAAAFRRHVLAEASTTEQPRVLTLREFVDEHFDAVVAGRAIATQKFYRAAVRNHLLPRFGDRTLPSFRKRDIDDFIVGLAATRSPTTANDYGNVLLRLLHAAVERDVLEEFPIKKRVTYAKEILPENELLPEERISLLRAFDDRIGFERVLRESRRSESGSASRDYFERFRAFGPVVRVALETGLRKGDLLGLTWRAVDLDRGWITLRMRKTGRRVTIPISEPCREALLDCRSRVPTNAATGGDLVFRTSRGRTFNKKQVGEYFSLAKRVAGITRRVRFHDLRHTVGSDLASAGVPVHLIAKLLGHRSTVMAERYARTRDTAMELVREKLEARARG